MSNQKVVEAKLKGFLGPYFPKTLAAAQKRLSYHPERINEVFLDQVTEALTPYKQQRVQMYQRTSDGYIWPGKIIFAHEGKKFASLIPQMWDTGRIDGTYASRHIALYPMAATDDGHIERAGAFFSAKFNDVYRELYRKSIEHSKASST